MKQPKIFPKLHKFLVEKPIPTLAVMALAAELVIELLGHSRLVKAFAFIGRTPLLFLLNTAIIFLTLLPAMLLRRKVFYSLFVTTVWIVFGIVNCVSLIMRTLPFSARDFTIIASGLVIADKYLSPLQIIAIIAAFAAVITLVVLLFIHAPCAEKPASLKKEIITVAVLAAAILAAGFISARKTDLSVDYEGVRTAYEQHGFPYCFITSIFESGVDRPENYSEEAVDELDAGDPVHTGVQPNIILIQLESFFDPALIRGLELKEDPIPHFTALRDSCASGFLRMPTIGAGTVNAEFEVLTGMSLDFFGLNEYPYESILRENTCENIAFYLKDRGYTTHAIHDYAGSFYGRNEVYPNLGFDDYTSMEYMQGIELTENGWPKDTVLTQYVLQAMEQTETPDFVFTVTVQCHGKYPDDSEIEDIHFRENEIFDESALEEFRYYSQQLQGTDQFLGELIAALEASSEKTVVIAYGDHLPSLGLEDEDLVNGSLFETQYFIWSNYGAGIGSEDEDLYAYQLTTRLFEIIGMSGGVITEYHEEHMEDEDYQEVLEMLEYDLLYGDRAAYNGVNPYVKTNMKMGLGEIFLDNVVFTGNTVEILGSGFTEFSVIYADGKRLEDTVFVSPGMLMYYNSSEDLTPDTEIEVCQTGEDRTILSTAVRRSSPH